MSTHDQSAVAASYARKSDKDDQGLQAQHLINVQAAQPDGYTIPATRDYRFEDDDTTGVSKQRNGFDRLLRVITSGHAPFTRVYIKDRTRLGRWSDPRYGMYLQVLCEEHGVRIRFADAAQQVEYGEQLTPEAMAAFFKEVFDAVISSEERTRLIKRVSGGLRYRVLCGFYPGARAPYGTDRWLADKRTGELIEQVPEGASLRREGCNYKLRWSGGESVQVIQDIFRWIEEENLSLKGCARRLNDRSVPTRGTAQRWSDALVRKLVRNPIYCGDLVWGRTTREGDPELADGAKVNGDAPILYRNFLPGAPIPRERFEAVQRILSGNRERWSRRKANKPEYLLSGLVVCAGCGIGYHGHMSTRAEQQRRRYYRHGTTRNPPAEGVRCPAMNRYVRADDLEDTVLATITHVLEDGRLVAAVRDELARRLETACSANHERELQEVERQIARYTAALDRAIRDRALAETEIERERCQTVIAQMSQEVESLRVRKREIASERERIERVSSQQAAIAARARDLRAALEEASDSQRKEVIATALQRIVIDPAVEHARIDVRAL